MSLINATNQLLLNKIFQDNLINYYTINISSIALLYPVTANSINIAAIRNGYAYSFSSCCPPSLAAAQSLTASLALTTYTVKSTANY